MGVSVPGRGEEPGVREPVEERKPVEEAAAVSFLFLKIYLFI